VVAGDLVELKTDLQCLREVRDIEQGE